MVLFADAGIPMLALLWPFAWLAFIPVVLIESAFCCKLLRLQWRKSLKVTALANGASTIAGVPLAWIGYLAFEIALQVMGVGDFGTVMTPWQKAVAVVSQAAWLPPYEKDLYWMIPSAAIVLCIPLFLVSVWIEYLVTARLVQNDRREVRRFCWLANSASYALIAVFWGLSPLIS